MTLPAQQKASPFHPGERAVQSRAGVRDEAEKRGQRMLTADINAQQLQFFHKLPFLITAHTDPSGQPWAGLVTGTPGFVSLQEHSHHCSLDWSKANNPTGALARPGSQLGLLGIELETRRRNRLNGTVFTTDDARWRLLVDQCYGNCPKYITERPWPGHLFSSEYELTEQEGLSESATTLANRTDAFFIATASGPETTDSQSQPSAWGVDVSHRGGEPGFLQGHGNRLVFDDYPGNNMFNTLGNIVQYPACGILLLDFSNGDIVQLAAIASIVHGDDKRTLSLDILSTRHWRAGSQAN